MNLSNYSTSRSLRSCCSKKSWRASNMTRRIPCHWLKHCTLRIFINQCLRVRQKLFCLLRMSRSSSSLNYWLLLISVLLTFGSWSTASSCSTHRCPHHWNVISEILRSKLSASLGGNTPHPWSKRSDKKQHKGSKCEKWRSEYLTMNLSPSTPPHRAQVSSHRSSKRRMKRWSHNLRRRSRNPHNLMNCSSNESYIWQLRR